MNAQSEVFEPSRHGGRNQPVDEAILVPVLNEEGVIGPFLAELAPHARSRRVYLLDSDSADATVSEAEEAARREGLDLRVVRCPAGLAESIRTGLTNSTEARIAVLDGDGQHEPDVVVALFDAVRSEADLAVGSRAVPGASVADDWPWYRSWGSRALSWIARVAARHHRVRDPLTGCFALRREAWTRVAPRFETGGYKFLLDFLAASQGRLAVAEAPLTFKARAAGASKMSPRVLWELLISLEYCMLRGRIRRRWLGFASVGLMGLATDTVLTGLLVTVAGVPFAWARPLPVLVAMTQNYALNNRFTFADARRSGTSALASGWVVYVACQVVGATVNWAVSVHVYGLGVPWFLALPVGVVAGMVVNFVAARRFVWPKR